MVTCDVCVCVFGCARVLCVLCGCNYTFALIQTSHENVKSLLVKLLENEFNTNSSVRISPSMWILTLL